MINHFRTAVAAALLFGAGVSAQAGPLSFTTTFYSPELPPSQEASFVKCGPQTNSIGPAPEFDGGGCGLPFTVEIGENSIEVINTAGGFAPGVFVGFVIEVDEAQGKVFDTVLIGEENFTGEPVAEIDGEGRLLLNFAGLDAEEEQVGSARFTFGLREVTTPVPEPGSLALVGLALATLGAAGRRRRPG